MNELDKLKVKTKNAYAEVVKFGGFFSFEEAIDEAFKIGQDTPKEWCTISSKETIPKTEIICSCGMPQSYPIPHEHDRTIRENQIIKHFKEIEQKIRADEREKCSVKCVDCVEQFEKQATAKEQERIIKIIEERIKDIRESIAMAIELDSMLNDSTTDILVYEQQIKELEELLKKLKDDNE